MRFFVLSDLHLRAEVENYSTSNRIKKLCTQIRTDTSFDETILFIVLGDIANKGDELSFTTADKILSLIIKELNGYTVKFEFVPGNHDIANGSLDLFNELISKYGNHYSYAFSSVHSQVYDGVNFIFADSTLSRDFAAPGRLDIAAIRDNIKPGLINALFCHHAISHGHGDLHDTIEDGATVLSQLTSMGVSYFFHGHVHDSNITIPVNGIVEIGCGSLSGDISFLSSVFHQFCVGYILDGKLTLVERWLDSDDGHGRYAVEALYPEPKSFADPDSINKISHAPVKDYIPRSVCLFEDANLSPLAQLYNQDKRISLQQAIQQHHKILLLCDAGMGKSTELNNLSYELSRKYHTFLYSLENYTGQDIQEILPVPYKALSPCRIALILDGYDEIDTNLVKTFRLKLKNYTQAAPGAHIIISSRSNFCGNEYTNESQNFPGLYVYVLNELTAENIQQFLKFNEIDETSFWTCAHVTGVTDLVYNPFYLIGLSDIFRTEGDLPPKKQLMDKLIVKTFDKDNQKFSGELGDQYRNLFSALELLALSMQLMHRQVFDDREEYQELISFETRELIKKSGLLTRGASGWKFLHNNIREYLAARCLSRLPQELVVSLIYDGTNIRPYWVNTLSFMTGFNLNWDLIGWLVEKNPSVLVKFEPDRLNTAMRVNVFKRIFGKYESLHLHFNDDLCDSPELAHFVNSEEILIFLLDRIRTPRHSISQYTAVNILRCYPCLFGHDTAVRETLLDCCNQYPTTDKTVCRLAMNALYQLNLWNSDTTSCLMQRFGDVNDDYIRLGMYEYLLGTHQQDDYVGYCLDGIHYILHSSNDDSRVLNEAFALANCLKNVSSVSGISCLLKWFSGKEDTDFCDSDKVLETAITTAISLYKTGHADLFDSLLLYYFDSVRIWNIAVSNALIRFFIETNTLYLAATKAVVEFGDEIHYISGLIYADSTVIEHIKKAYINGELPSHCAFHNLVQRYVEDEIKYSEYSKLIKEIDGVELPAFKHPIDYNMLRRKAVQEYLDALFDEAKLGALTNQLLRKTGDPQLTAKQLLKADIHIDYPSPLQHLRFAMHGYAPEEQVSEFFNRVNRDRFILWSSSQFLSKKFVIVLPQEQKDMLSEVVTRILSTQSFKNCIHYNGDNISFSHLTIELLRVILYLDYPLDENTLLDLTELPACAFDSDDDKTKYKYISSKLSHERLRHRLIENVTTHRVKSFVLMDHIAFFERYNDASIAENALSICCAQSDSYLRSNALRYLFNTLGSEYIANNILPIADGELLVEIAVCCKDISKENLCKAMEREYKKNPSMQLQAHLITLGSNIAINDYVDKVTSDFHLPEGTGIHSDGPTSAIGTIHDSTFLPQLEVLLVTVLNSHFEDSSMVGLRNSLTEALANCGQTAYDETIKVITMHCPSAAENEDGYRYCNFTIEKIERAKKISLDTPKSLSAVKDILNRAKQCY